MACFLVLTVSGNDLLRRSGLARRLVENSQSSCGTLPYKSHQYFISLEVCNLGLKWFDWILPNKALPLGVKNLDAIMSGDTQPKNKRTFFIVRCLKTGCYVLKDILLDKCFEGRVRVQL